MLRALRSAEIGARQCLSLVNKSKTQFAPFRSLSWAAGSPNFPESQSLATQILRGKFGAIFSAGVVLGFGLATPYAFAEPKFFQWLGDETQTRCMNVGWVQELAGKEGTELVLSADTMHTHPLLKKDHMFSNLHEHQMVQDMVCFYSPAEKKLQYAIQLGRNVCGFPSIMHGGLTAAIVDESFGFLWLSLRANKQLPFTGPAFTAHLEVDYKQKIPAGRLLLCTTEVESCEGRKLWMTATVRDGPTGKVYATARALFVRPKTQKLLQEGIKFAYSYLRAE